MLIKYSWTFQFGCQMVPLQGVNLPFLRGFNCHPLEGAGSYVSFSCLDFFVHRWPCSRPVFQHIAFAGMGLIYSLSLLALRMLGFLGSFGVCCAATHEKISSRMKVLLSAKMIIFHFPI